MAGNWLSYSSYLTLGLILEKDGLSVGSALGQAACGSQFCHFCSLQSVASTFMWASPLTAMSSISYGS